MLPARRTAIHDAGEVMTDELLATLGLYGGTLVVCFISGLVPIVNAELFLVGISAWAVTSPAQLPLVAVAAGVGQMSAKIILYFMGLGLFELPRGRWKAAVERARLRMDRWRRRPHVVLALSATVSLPPFLLVSIAAGALRIGFRTFCAIGLIGRTLRFGVILTIPWLVH
jgi:membrane protein YqaA with SNARE-associated domain